jgi:hypothetical protein
MPLGPSKRRRTALIGGAVVVALAVALGVAALLGASEDETAEPPSQVDLVNRLVADFERSRRATYVIEGEYTRTMPDGRQLASAMLEVRRPPDKLHRRLGSAGGQLDGRVLNCSTDGDGRFSCAPGAPAPDWEQEVAQEVADLRQHFDWKPRPFTIADAGGGCYDITRADWYPHPGEGVPVRMCFDAVTGALRYLELEHEGGARDVMSAITIRAVVADSDFQVADNERFDPRQPG